LSYIVGLPRNASTLTRIWKTRKIIVWKSGFNHFKISW
jgi:hypothetical protein